MDESLDKIIQYIESSIQGLYSGLPQHTGSLHLSSRIGFGYQLLFGVCNTDPHSLDISHYQYNIVQELNGKFPKPDFLAFPFEQKGSLIAVLGGLSQRYNAALNIPRLIRDIKFNDSRPVYLVVVFIKFPIILPDKED